MLPVQGERAPVVNGYPVVAFIRHAASMTRAWHLTQVATR